MGNWDKSLLVASVDPPNLALTMVCLNLKIVE